MEVSNSCGTIRREANVYWASSSDTALVYFPNVIALDAEQAINQTFRPFFASDLDVTVYHLEVFDRWGNQVFASRQPENGWNGQVHNRNLESSVFVWQMQAVVNFCGRQIEMRKSGDVLVMRN